MKIFQIHHGLCYWDATPKHKTLESTQGLYSPEIVFVEAPDYVFENWGYDESKEGEARFVKPVPPEGWGYDDETGQFYELEPKEPPRSPEQVMLDALLAAGVLTKEQYDEAVGKLSQEG